MRTRQDVHRMVSKGLKVLLSASLVWSAIPTTALAQTSMVGAWDDALHDVVGALTAFGSQTFTTGSWVDGQLQAIADDEQSVTDARGAVTIKQAEIDELTSAITAHEELIADAQSDADAKHEAARTATSEAEAAERDLAFAQDAQEQNEAAITARQEELEALRQRKQTGTSAEVAALEDAQETFNAAQAAVAEKQAALDEANVAWGKGSLGFFESVGATDAVNALTTSTYASLTQTGDPDDAIALKNMKASFEWMYYLNDLREELGLPELYVTDYLMACAQADVNYSDTKVAHAQQFNDLSLTGYWSGENISWGYSNPFDGWYGEEKALFDYAYMSITGSEDVPTGAAAYTWAIDHSQEIKTTLQNANKDTVIGHYTNTINPNFGSAGFAISYRNTLGYGNTMGQFFGGTIDGAYTVTEYEERFDEYYDALTTRIADSEQALEDANAAVTEAQGKVATAEEALAAAEADLETIDQQIAEAQEELDALVAKRATIQSDIENAQAAVEQKNQAKADAEAAAETADAQVSALANDATYLEQKSQFTTASLELTAAQQAVEEAETSLAAKKDALHDALSLEGDNVEVSFSQATYTGAAVEPEVTVTVTMPDESQVTLVRNVDYTLTLEQNVNVADQPVVIITGLGDEEGGWRGTRTETFAISAADIAHATVAEIPNQTFADGDEVKPTVTVTFGGTTLVEGTDYTVSYGNNVNVGTATVTIAGMGNFTGSTETTFTIVGTQLTTDMVTAADVTYTGAAITGNVTVKYGEVTLVEGTDFAVEYEDKTDVGTATATITGKGGYEGTVTVSFNILPRPVTVRPASVEKAYGDTDPELTATVKGLVGDDAIDYELSREEGEDVGSYKVTATGEELQGNYAVTYATGTLSIKALTLTEDMVSAPANKVYTGKALASAPTVTVGEKTLVAGTDYTVSYANNVNVGTATATVTGKGNYAGTVETSFSVTARGISSATAAKVANQTYTGKALKPALTLTYGGRTLKAGTDYTLSYKANVNVGTATVTARGKGNFKGTKSVTFKVVAAPISKAAVAKIADQRCDGTARKPAPKVTFGGKTLKKGTDYTLSWSNNVKAGTATVTITGKGNFKGAKKATFRIVKGTWKGGSGGWWYEYPDGSYLKSQFANIDGSRYYFDASGWMVTGWRQVGGKWYYFRSDGKMAIKWVQSNGSWYYLEPSGSNAGVMVANQWRTIDGTRYHFNASGVWDK